MVGQQWKLLFVVRFELQLVQEQTWRLQPGFALEQKLWCGPELAFVWGQVEGLPSVSGQRSRASSGPVRGFRLELEWILGFEESEVGRAS